MQVRQSFLFTCWEGGGNVPPVLGLAAKLVKRGHQVRILAEPCLKKAVEDIGAEFIAFSQHFTRTDPTIDLIQDWKAKPLSIPAVDNVMVGPALDVANETQAALKAVHTDVLIADFMMPGSLMAAEALGIKRVALFHMPEYLPGPGRPPGGLGLLPNNSLFGKLRDKALTQVFNRVLNQYLPTLNKARNALSLAPYRCLTDAFHQADFRFIQTSKAFDAAITPAPDNLHYVGPVLDDPSWVSHKQKPALISDIRSLWPEDDSRPLVVVSLSSTFQNQRPVLERIITALGNLEIRALVTLGPAMENETFRLADNLRVVSSLPHSQVFAYADAVITHAGHGTVMRALANGLPLVCLPMGRDQIDNAALVAHHGAGIKLKASASPNKIRKAITHLLNTPEFKSQAQSLQKNIQADASQDIAERLLESMN